ncbi:hypothetical protein DL766_010353 [Monosporascus sp. MC13-8B]|uniref:Uncharacterized protein n=1 Tax=Monosporascus cannonballus TaxID=155416 RepID=A0ABY0HM76_9PEZI|nr:hypothetical protein DL763_004727 [Monosporascus cannonballus]RYO94005.1 hypothetical protein DL762_000753 [Monosporascus cannonballus]RYP02455.1 hypothetical protein DL766_010353 [Monosporascus sp. MC13-8B]
MPPIGIFDVELIRQQTEVLIRFVLAEDSLEKLINPQIRSVLGGYLCPADFRAKYRGVSAIMSRQSQTFA